MKSPPHMQFAIEPVLRWLVLILLIQWGGGSPPSVNSGRLSPGSSLLEVPPAASWWDAAEVDSDRCYLQLLTPEFCQGEKGKTPALAVGTALRRWYHDPRPESAFEIPPPEAPPPPAGIKPDRAEQAQTFLNPAPLQPGEKTGSTFHSIILEVAARYKIHPALVKAIIMAESGFNVKAVSSCGAKGLMQLMPRTASALGVNDLFDPKANIEGGVSYFKKLVDMFEGDIKLALAAYNAGHGRVKKYNGIPPFRATQYYIRKVVRYYEHYSGTRWSSLVKSGYLSGRPSDQAKAARQS